MGARQSKRSVDISGKEAEGEVVAVGGEGKLEPIADVDTLKPQPNGDAAHGDSRQQDNENVKENGEAVEPPVLEEKKVVEEAVAPITNGTNADETPTEAIPADETGEVKPTEEEKKKKGKGKKRWSFRMISFNSKDKPKHEKKVKDEESKANGEEEKLTEEANDAVAESNPTENEKKDAVEGEKTPETPVTEQLLSNGSSAPETPKDESPVEEIKIVEAKEAVEVVKIPTEASASTHVNEEIKCENGSVEQSAEVISADPPIEVCVPQVEESSPPPLPDIPPPSSVIAFAETTMAQHLIDTNLADKLVESSDVKEPELTAETNTQAICTNESEKNDSTSTEINDEIEIKHENNLTKENTQEVPAEKDIVQDIPNQSQLLEDLKSENEVPIENGSNENFEQEQPDLVSEDQVEVKIVTDETVEDTTDLPLPPADILNEEDVKIIQNFVSDTLEAGENAVHKMMTTVEAPEAQFVVENDVSESNGESIERLNGIEKETCQPETLTENEHINGFQNGHSEITTPNGAEETNADSIVHESDIQLIKKKVKVEQNGHDDLPAPPTEEFLNGDEEMNSSSQKQESITDALADKLGEIKLPESVPEIVSDIMVSTTTEVVSAGDH